MQAPIRIISSMATRQLLAELADEYRKTSNQPIDIESVGGVDAAKRVQAGEAFDVVVLASNAIDQLAGAGAIVDDSRADLVKSGVSIAVRAGAPHPDVSTEDALRRAVLDSASIGYSTGPSGVALTKLFERWGIAEQIRERIVQAPPGVPVGSLVADGRIALGFQQLSELMNLPGIDVLGPLPSSIQVVTTFTAGVARASAQPAAARALIAFLAAPEAAEIKRRNGMEPA
jgi:molybdate transport system substrate-binding protein